MSFSEGEEVGDEEGAHLLSQGEEVGLDWEGVGGCGLSLVLWVLLSVVVGEERREEKGLRRGVKDGFVEKEKWE